MSTITLDSKVSQREDVLTADMGEELVMMSLERSNYYGLGGIETYIWKQLEKPQNVSQLCEHLLTRFELDCQQCHRDVVDFLIELHQEGLVHVHQSSNP